MAIAVAKTPLCARPPLFLCATQARRRSSAALAVETIEGRPSDQPSAPLITKNSKQGTLEIKRLIFFPLIL